MGRKQRNSRLRNRLLETRAKNIARFHELDKRKSKSTEEWEEYYFLKHKYHLKSKAKEEA